MQNRIKATIFLSNLFIGGTEKATIELSKEMRLAGHDFSIDSYIGGPLLDDVRKAGIPCDIYSTGIAFEAMWSGLRKTFPYLFIMAVKKALRWRKHGVEYVIATCPVTSILSVATKFIHGASVVSWVHFNWAEESKKMDSKLRQRTLWAYRNSDRFVSVSAGALVGFKEAANFVCKSAVIYNIIPDGSSIDPHLATQRNMNMILWVGRVVEIKQVDHLLRAFSQAKKINPSLALRVVGPGDASYLAKLHFLRDSLGLNESDCSFVGPSKLVNQEMQTAGLLVLCSKHEALPTVLIESMRNRLPFLSYDTNFGPREISLGGTAGLLVEQGDIDALANGMVEMTSNNELRQTFLNKASSQALPLFSSKEIVTAWQQLLNEH